MGAILMVREHGSERQFTSKVLIARLRYCGFRTGACKIVVSHPDRQSFDSIIYLGIALYFSSRNVHQVLT